MKKNIFSLFALVGMAISAYAQSVTVSDVYVKAGGTGVVALNFSCSSENADKYTGMQIQLTFPSEGFTMADKNAISGWDGTLEYNMNAEVAKFSAAGSNTFETTTILVEFSASNTLALSSYPVTISGQFEGPGVDDAVVEGSFNVIVTDVYTLDENSQALPDLDGDLTVRVLRTVKANEWSTICLPLYMSVDDVKNIFGDGTQLATFKGYTYNSDDDKMEVEFENAKPDGTDLLLANKLYIIKATKDVSDFTFDTYFEASTTLQTDYKVGRTVKGSFIGTYAANTVVPANSLFLSENKFWYSTGKTKMKAFRAYFNLSDVLSSLSSASSRVKFFINDGDTATEIQSPEFMPNDGEYYNLNGLRVETPAKGVYIKDGKKVVVK